MLDEVLGFINSSFRLTLSVGLTVGITLGFSLLIFLQFMINTFCCFSSGSIKLLANNKPV